MPAMTGKEAAQLTLFENDILAPNIGTGHSNTWPMTVNTAQNAAQELILFKYLVLSGVKKLTSSSSSLLRPAIPSSDFTLSICPSTAQSNSSLSNNEIPTVIGNGTKNDVIVANKHGIVPPVDAILISPK